MYVPVKWRASSFSHDPFSLSLHSFPSCMPPSSVDKLTPTPLVRALFDGTDSKYRSYHPGLSTPCFASTPWLFAFCTRSTTYQFPLPSSLLGILSSNTCCTNPSSLPICLYSFSTSRSSSGRRNTNISSYHSLANGLFSPVRNIECTNPCLCAIYSCTSILRRSFYRR